MVVYLSTLEAEAEEDQPKLKASLNCIVTPCLKRHTKKEKKKLVKYGLVTSSLNLSFYF